MKQDGLMMPTDALSQINYGHTRHCEIAMRFACVNEKLKGIWNIREVNAYIAEWKISSSPPPPFTFQNAPPPLARSTLLHKSYDSSILTDSSFRHFAWSL